MKAIRTILLSVTFVAVVFLFAACNGNLFYSASHSVSERGWSASESLPFDVQVDDTNMVFNFLVDLRITPDYPYSNTFLFITTTFPDGSVAADTMECPLAAPDGNWLGQKTGRYIDNRYFFRKNIRFPLVGRYHFDVSHGMRTDSIVGFKDVGIRIEYSK